MRVRNTSKVHVDDIAPGGVGDVRDNAANRALLGVVLEEVDASTPGPGDTSPGAPRDEDLPPYLARDASAAELRQELGELVAFLRKVEAARDEAHQRASSLGATLEDTRIELSLREGRVKELEAHVAQLSSELADARAKKPTAKPDPKKVEG